jgi:hypothetical protein
MDIFPQAAARARRRISLWRVRGVLRQGLEDPYYRARLQEAGLGSAGAIRSARSLESLLGPLPYSDLAGYRKARPDLRCHYPEVVAHPLHPRLQASQPKNFKTRCPALAGPPWLLRHLARLHPSYRIRTQFAVLVLRGPGDDDLTESDRSLLWDAFQVPVSDAFIGFDGELLAWECEAHCGMHVTREAVFEGFGGRIYFTSLTDREQPSIRLETGLSGRLVDGRCECGRPGPRLAGPAEPGAFSSAAD